jgi:hypothetical protein
MRSQPERTRGLAVLPVMWPGLKTGRPYGAPVGPDRLNTPDLQRLVWVNVADIERLSPVHNPPVRELASNQLAHQEASRLKLLVEQGVLTKHRDPEHGSRRVYRLTPKGAVLIPLLVEMIVFDGKQDPESPVTEAWMKHATDNRAAFIQELRVRATRGTS